MITQHIRVHKLRAQGLSEMDVPEWSNSAPRTRNVTYVKPINVPLGPKSAQVQEAHTVSGCGGMWF